MTFRNFAPNATFLTENKAGNNMFYVEIGSSNSLRLFSYFTCEWKQKGSHDLCSSSSLWTPQP